MTYHVNQLGRVVRTAENATLPIEWNQGPVYLDPESDDVRAFSDWFRAGNVPTPYAPTKDEQNAPILRELEANDKKAIRALLEGDSVRVSEWKAKQAALRARLK